MEQNHQAHITVHMSMLQDPHMQQLLQNNPQAPQIQAAIMAHVNEHLGFEYRRQIEQKLGATLPTKDREKNYPKIDAQMADQIAAMAAQAAQQLTQQNQQQAAQQQAQQQQQDPIVQMQQQELQLKQQELQLKAQKQQSDTQEKVARIQIEQARIEAQKEIAAMQVAATAAANKDRLGKETDLNRAKLMSQNQLEGMKLGVDMQKHKHAMSIQKHNVDKQTESKNTQLKHSAEQSQRQAEATRIAKPTEKTE